MRGVRTYARRTVVVVVLARNNKLGEKAGVCVISEANGDGVPLFFREKRRGREFFFYFSVDDISFFTTR